jgi:PAS domain S-box-containing protein
VQAVATRNKDEGVETGRLAKQRPALPRQLQGSTEAFRPLVEHMPIPLAVIRRVDNVILYTNPALDELLGIVAAKLWNRNSDFLFPKLEDRRHLKSLLNRDGHVRGEEVTSCRRDGTALRLLVWQTLMTCADIECLLMVLVDVTKRQAAEDAKQEQLEAVEQVLKWNDREHQLIAYEIHDGFVQQMLTALMQLDAYRWGLQEGRPNVEEKLDAVSDALRQGTAEARRLIDRVRPPDLATAGLVGALRTLTQRVSQSGEVSVELSMDRSFPQFAPESETAIYRIVQECLTNVCRHSQSNRARVELRDGEQELKILVQDWGIGFATDSAVAGHYGLLGIRDRARLLGGRTEIDSAPGAGTRVTLFLPRKATVLAPLPKGQKAR